jgi:hypothetical protein
MKNIFKIALAGVLLTTSGCVIMQTNSGSALLSTNVTEPHSFANGVNSTKMGEACQKTIIGLISTGDSSIEKAKKNGGITKVASVDVEKSGFLVYGKSCTIVRGE